MRQPLFINLGDVVGVFSEVRIQDHRPAHVRAFKAHTLDWGVHPNTVGGMQGGFTCGSSSISCRFYVAFVVVVCCSKP